MYFMYTWIQGGGWVLHVCTCTSGHCRMLQCPCGQTVLAYLVVDNKQFIFFHLMLWICSHTLQNTQLSFALPSFMPQQIPVWCSLLQKWLTTEKSSVFPIVDNVNGIDWSLMFAIVFQSSIIDGFISLITSWKYVLSIAQTHKNIRILWYLETKAALSGYCGISIGEWKVGEYLELEGKDHLHWCGKCYVWGFVDETSFLPTSSIRLHKRGIVQIIHELPGTQPHIQKLSK